jgi:hypothetical protein
MGNSLEAPNTDKITHAYTSSTGIEVGGWPYDFHLNFISSINSLAILGCSGMQGWRLEMEDSHISIDIPSRPDHLLLVVLVL